MSGTGAKRRSTRVPTSGSVGSDSSHTTKKAPGGAKLSSNGAILKSSGMDTDGEASNGGRVSDSKINTPQAKCFNNGAVIGSIIYDMEEEEEKSFALDINLSAVEGKSAIAKTQTVSLARKNNIIVNSDLRRQGIHSDQAIVIKEIPMDMPKEMIIAAVSEFGQVLAAKWSFLIGKNLVCMAKAVRDHKTWASKDWYRALLFTLPVETMAHNLGDLLAGADTGNRVYCAVVCFENDKVLESVFCTEPIFGGVKLSWARLDMVWCEQCGKLDHSVLECDAETSTSPKLSKSFKRVVSDENHLQLAKLYVKKNMPIFRPAAFDSKSWTQVVSLVSLSNSPHFGFGPGFGSFSGASDVVGHLSPAGPVNSLLKTCLTSLEHSLELLMNKVSGIIDKLNNLNLVPLALVSSSQSLVVSITANMEFGLDMVLDEPKSVVLPPSLVSSGVSSLGPSSSKILTSKVGCLELKLMALKASVCSVLEKLDQMCAGSANKFPGVHVFISGVDSGHLGSGVAIVLNESLSKHVYKVSEIPDWLISIKLLFRNKISVSVLGLYAGASSATQFFQAADVNSFIARAVNKSFFVILGGNFNEDSSHRCASFRKCFNLGLVNALNGSLFTNLSIWCNSYDVSKMIDYMFVSSGLVNAIVDRSMVNVDEFFDTDYKAVSISADLGGLLNMQLSSLCKQANKNCWKFNVRNITDLKWLDFKILTTANVSVFSNKFAAAKSSSDLDSMWDVIRKVVVLSAGGTFKKKWFKDYDSVYTKESSRFHKLELLVSKLVKASRSVSSNEFALLLSVWDSLNPISAAATKSIFFSGASFDVIYFLLAKVKKSYHSFKLMESKHAEESQIKQAITRRMESFESDKDYTIRSVLKHPFHKVVLDYIMVSDELVLEPMLVKSKPLDYVFDEAFASVMSPIDFDEMLVVILNLPDGKAAGLSDISNELWKHCNKLVLDMVLVFLNCCLVCVLMNTCPIALIETACKSATQHILNIASDFFRINDISINNEKTVVIPINCRVANPALNISGLPISVAKKGEPHCYLGIFLSSKGLSRPSLNALIHKGLKSKSGLPLNFLNDALYYPSLYSLKTFEQVQAESSSVASTFHLQSGTPFSFVLGNKTFFRCVSSLHWYGVAFVEQLQDHNSASCSIWYGIAIHFIANMASSSVGFLFLDGCMHHDVLQSCEFGVVSSNLLNTTSSHLSVYTNSSLCGLGTLDMKAGAAVFFEDLNLGLGVNVSGLVSSTLAKLQAIALALKCVPSLSSVDLFSDSQTALDACVSESVLLCLDFRNQCWIKHCHIANVICHKRLDVNWVKVKDYFGMLDNKRADALAKVAAFSDFHLPPSISERVLVAGGTVVSGNSRHFVHDIFQSVHHAHWEMSLGFQVIMGSLRLDIDWFRSSLV
ncbi:hypothetical protein G9A89_018172 [Geosiphon pyriformis]|nr:hypothetical protein G9A89_018172 [Geosiphon pyriformis]